MFKKIAEGDPYATKEIPNGILCRDQYGTKCTYGNGTLTFKYGGCEDEDAVLFATVISALEPIKIYTSGDECTIQVPNVTPERAAEIVKKVFEV